MPSAADGWLRQKLAERRCWPPSSNDLMPRCLSLPTNSAACGGSSEMKMRSGGAFLN